MAAGVGHDDVLVAPVLPPLERPGVGGRKNPSGDVATPRDRRLCSRCDLPRAPSDPSEPTCWGVSFRSIRKLARELPRSLFRWLGRRKRANRRSTGASDVLLLAGVQSGPSASWMVEIVRSRSAKSSSVGDEADSVTGMGVCAPTGGPGAVGAEGTVGAGGNADPEADPTGAVARACVSGIDIAADADADADTDADADVLSKSGAGVAGGDRGERFSAYGWNDEGAGRYRDMRAEPPGALLVAGNDAAAAEGELNVSNSRRLDDPDGDGVSAKSRSRPSQSIACVRRALMACSKSCCSSSSSSTSIPALFTRRRFCIGRPGDGWCTLELAERSRLALLDSSSRSRSPRMSRVERRIRLEILRVKCALLLPLGLEGADSAKEESGARGGGCSDIGRRRRCDCGCGSGSGERRLLL